MSRPTRPLQAGFRVPMLTLDARTLFVATTTISLYISLMLFLYSRNQKIYPGFWLWLAGNLLAFTTYLLFTARGFIPDFFSIPMANAVGVLSTVFRMEGMKKFFDKNAKLLLPNFLIPLLVLILQTYFTFIVDDIRIRNTIFSIFTSLMALRMCRLLLLSSDKSTKALTLFFSVMLLAFVIGQGIRAINWFVWVDNRGVMTSSPFNSISVLFLMIFDISWGVYLILLNSQRMNREITDLTDQLEELASMDSLTGVFNRRKFLEIGITELARAQRYRRKLSLLMFDLNNFKDVNDTYGHAAGDEILKQVVNVCRKYLRQQDVLGRFGGDEFIILLPETNLMETIEIAQRLNHGIQSIPYERNWHVHVSISYGAAEAADTDKELDQLMQRADVLLYDMKAQKRNQASPIKRTPARLETRSKESKRA